MLAPIRSASAIAARAPAISVPRPATTGTRLAASNLAASAVATWSATGRPSIQAWLISAPPAWTASRARHSGVVFDIGEARVRGRRAFERLCFFPGLPMDHVLDLLGQLEVFVSYALGSMVLQAHFHPCIRGSDVGMMPSGLGERTDRIDHQQCSFPTVSAVLAADPAAFQIPVRQFLLEALFDLFVGICAFLAAFAHGVSPLD